MLDTISSGTSGSRNPMMFYTGLGKKSSELRVSSELPAELKWLSKSFSCAASEQI